MDTMPEKIITYRMYDASSQNSKPWSEAKDACSASGSLLALLDSMQKIAAVQDSLSKGPYWIGLKYNTSIQEFVWSSGEVANKSFLKSLYDGNEKSLVSSGKTCFLLKKSNDTFQKEKCTKKYGFICQTTGQEGPPSTGQHEYVTMTKSRQTEIESGTENIRTSYIHTYIHTYIRTSYIRHTYIHTYMHAYIHTYCIYIHTCIHTCICT